MKNILAIVVMMMVSFAVVAADTQTFNRPDGSVQHVIPVTEQKCKLHEKSNVGNAAIGAGVGYATTRVLTNSSKNSGLWGLAGAAAGALIGANTQKEQQCRYEEVVTGYKVITITKDGKMTEKYVPAAK